MVSYKRVLILGTDQFANDCAIIIKNNGLMPEIFDTNKEKSPVLEEKCVCNGLLYKHITWTDLTDLLLSLKEKTLLISAFNLYLVPKEVINKKNITAINCHHAILPDRPGRNGATWAIFEQDKEAGITWHFITEKADAGNIICIKKISLDDKITALRLLKHQYDLALDSFIEIISDLLSENITCTPQDPGKKGPFRYSYDIPNEGKLDLSWNFDKMSAFLRAMDYGILEVLGQPYLALFDNNYKWKRYVLLPPDGDFGIQKKNDSFIISTQHGCIRLDKISIV